VSKFRHRFDVNPRSRQRIASRAPIVLQSPLRITLAVLAGLIALLHLGWREPPIADIVLHVAIIVTLAAYGFALWRSFSKLADPEARRSVIAVTRPEQAAVFLGVLFGWLAWPVALTAAGLLLIVQLVRLFLELVQTRVHPGLVFVGSFVVLVAAGTGALMLPAATPAAAPIGFVDALFTITSAISQTGITVRPTGLVLAPEGTAIGGFTRFGQIIILIWIQIGALGVIVFGALIVTVLGSSFGLRATQTLAEGTEQGWAGQLSMQRLVTFIVVFTHLVQLVAAAVLFFGWPEQWPGMPEDMKTLGDRVFHAVFFSISGFCNAGFVTTGDSLISLRTHWTTHTIIAPLIFLGSIGFPVLDNLRSVAWRRLKGVRHDMGGLVRLNLNTKIILVFTLAMYLLGVLAIVISEARAETVDPEHWWVSFMDGHFMSINRTAGFNSVDTAELGPLAHLALIFLMFVGGAPVSVAGGIKLMVFAVLTLTVWSTLLGRSETTAFGRTIPESLIRKSATLIVLGLLIVLAGTGVLVVSDPQHTLREHLFEVSSAFGTCGLSLYETGDLSNTGKITLVIAMFVGRVGPLAVLAALIGATAGRSVRIEYPHEDVVIY
jgi:trk system potassium uptake protein